MRVLLPLDRKWHPDKNQESEESIKKADHMFAAVAEAYKVLGDEKRRRFYDQVSSCSGLIYRAIDHHFTYSCRHQVPICVSLLLILDAKRRPTKKTK